MNEARVRLSEVSIKNFKNVKYGKLNFYNKRKEYQASVLGLYGQNGSGKTALIDVIHLLKFIICGKPIPSYMADYINVDSSNAELLYKFDVRFPDGVYEAFYSVSLKKEANKEDTNIEFQENGDQLARVLLYNEILGYSFKGKEHSCRKSDLINTASGPVFGPASKYNCLIGKNKNDFMDLLVVKKITEMNSRSFIFSREFLNVIREKNSGQSSDIEYLRHVRLMERLVQYGNYELFVINTASTGLISMNALPISFKYANTDTSAVGQLMIPIDSPTVIPAEVAEIIKKVTDDVNIVLDKIIPGLTINIRELGAQPMPDGRNGIRIQLMSSKNKKDIPLKYESDGIKKIISILHLMIVVYNRSSITVAIDEIDSGIFEYLLGELIRIISEKGKGQLIFTSHNLRPLETIDRGFIAFTTTDPEKRYIRMINVKENNNLRDYYFRDIVLGEQPEELYDLTNNSEIALAFREAGETIGS